jgi:hypothetical protein
MHMHCYHPMFPDPTHSCSGFKTARVISFDVDDDGESGGLGLNIQTQVTNPGSASARLGLVAFDVMYEGQSLGSVEADVNVQPGHSSPTPYHHRLQMRPFQSMPFKL